MDASTVIVTERNTLRSAAEVLTECQKSGIRAGVEKALTLSSQKIKLIIVTNITQMRGITITARNKQMAYLFEKISFSV